MPEVEIPEVQRGDIIELFRYLGLVSDREIYFDDLLFNQFRQPENPEDLPTLADDISVDDKRDIWGDCRHGLQRLLLRFTENGELTEEQLEWLYEIIIQLGAPIYDLKRENDILLQVREYDQHPSEMNYVLDLDNSLIHYEIDH